VDDGRYRAVLVDNPFISHRVRTQLPIIFDVIDHYADIFRCELGESLKYRQLVRLERREISRASLRIVQGPGMINLFGDFGKTTVIANGYNKALFYYELESTLNGLPVVVFQGKLSLWYRNILNIAEACRFLPVTLVVMGDGPLLGQIRRANLPNLLLTGALSPAQVATYTRRAAICLFTTDDESPIAIHEYMACGKPIISVSGRIEWLLQDGKGGFLCDGSIHAYRDRISTLLGNALLRARMGAQNLVSKNNRDWALQSAHFKAACSDV
jgi:glycosyltransferase involved in cell wall biosynthesis